MDLGRLEGNGLLLDNYVRFQLHQGSLIHNFGKGLSRRESWTKKMAEMAIP